MNHKRVLRMMREDNLLCVRRRAFVVTTDSLQELQAHGVRFIATSQNIDTDESNPAARFLLHILMAAAEFERELIQERSMAGQKRYRSQYEAGKVGKEVHSKSGKDLPIGRPKEFFDRKRVFQLREQRFSYREIARQLGIGEGTVRRILRQAVNQHVCCR